MAQILNLLSRATGKGNADGKPLNWIRASKGETTYQIAVDEVLLFQSDDKYTVVYTANGEHLISKTLAELARALDPEKFWQVHRSTLVNIGYVSSSKRDDEGRVSLNIKGYAKAVPVSRSYQHLFRHM